MTDQESKKTLPHRYRMPSGEDDAFADDSAPEEPRAHRSKIEPWLTAMFQSEHLSLLLGRGFSLGVAAACGARTTHAQALKFPPKHATRITARANASAERMGRGKANFEDEIRSASELLAGLRILEQKEDARDIENALDEGLRGLLQSVIADEAEIEARLEGTEASIGSAYDALGPFLMSFASRSSSRDRLHIFTTNYDRVVEYGCERVGLRILDRFVGTLSPFFRSSRLEVDLHYNPPGVRGEPRFLEGVVRLTKLHGSADWRFGQDRVRRVGLPFGVSQDHPEVANGQTAVIYPNASKDVETSEFPYSELFRDFSAAISRPNSVLVTYGYGFGDSHVNAAINDMLTIPSTHLVVISFDEADGRVQRFIDRSHAAQVSYLIGPHFGDLSTLVQHYLPKAAIDRITTTRAKLMQDRGMTQRAVSQVEADTTGEGSSQ